MSKASQSQSQAFRIAVLLATYNGELHLKRQLDTILNQKEVEVSLFISDDDSTDRTLEIIQSFSHRKEFIINVISTKKRFGSAARNFYNLIKNVDVTSFDYVSFADQDDIWLEEKLKNAVEEINLTGSSAYSSNFYTCWGDIKINKLTRKNYPLTDVDHWFESPGPGCSQVFKAKDFSKFQEFVEDKWEVVQNIRYHDWLVYAFFRYYGLKWHISNNADFYYMQHENNEIGANYGFKAFIHRLKLLQSGWYRNQVHAIHFAVTGNSRELLCLNFFYLNHFKIRRKKMHSIFLSLGIIFKIF